jgi:exodeoxyribonuclease-1
MRPEKRFIFYDTETSGLNKMFGQIFQFAAILTDENFQILDQFELRSRRMPHIVPDPGALLVTGVTPEQLEIATDTYFSFASKIREKLLSWSPAIFSGYNIFSFDEHFMRSMYYQNLFPPYLSQTNGNKRLDVLPLVRAAEQLFPNSLNFPVNERGKTSKKLEDVAAANGFSSHNAHDAMGDVLATIHVAELIRDRTPVLWTTGLAAGSRADFNRVIADENWFVVHDHNNGWPVTFPAIEVSKADNGRNSLLFDLRRDPREIESNPLEDNFKGRNRPFRVVRSAEMPLVFGKDQIEQLDLALDLDFEELDDLAIRIKQSALIYETAHLRDQTREKFDTSPNIEAQIYEDFSAFDRERYLMEDFHSAANEEKISIAEQFSDERFRAFAKRIIFENFPEQLTASEVDEFKQKITERISDEDDVPWTTKQKAIEQCDRMLESRVDVQSELVQIRHYIKNL